MCTRQTDDKRTTSLLKVYSLRPKLLQAQFLWCIFFQWLHINLTTACYAECPADFTHIASVNGCYKVLTRNLQWSVAGLECRSLHKDAHLLVINNQQEQSAVAGMLASTNRQYSFHKLTHPFLLCTNLRTIILCSVHDEEPAKSIVQYR